MAIDGQHRVKGYTSDFQETEIPIIFSNDFGTKETERFC